MPGIIKNKVVQIKRNLTSLDNQPISKAALIVLIFLDLFILLSIFNGLEDHTRQLTRPWQIVPQYCRNIVIEGQWNKTNRLARLAKTVSNSRGGYQMPDERERSRERHPQCDSLAKLFLMIGDDEELFVKLKKFLRIQRETVQLNSELARTKGAFDTSLLEKMADQKNESATVESLKEDAARKTASINKTIQELKMLEASIEQDKRIQEIFAIIESVSEADRSTLRDDLRKLNFWYPVKRLSMEMIFLLPLFLVFYFWNIKSISGNRPFQTLVSSHLLVIVFIPVIFKIIELVYDIIPKKLLKNIIELLESLKLVALWHYLLMSITILVALAMIYLFQKKLFSQEKLINKRISKGSCQNCGKHLPSDILACPFCGFEQFKQCIHCSKPTYVYGNFCKECGRGNN